ncbi:MAG: aspartate aminotransferase family protein [Candidatus Odinarchaeia archaeon]
MINLKAEDLMSIEDKYTAGVYGKRGVVVAKGEGAILWDVNGEQYIDCVAGHGVNVLGHSHPNVVKAIKEQAERLITAPGIFYNDIRAIAAKKLAEVTPDGLNKTFYSNSGTEAVETAIKLARKYMGKKEIIAAIGGFHGRTLGALSATWKKEYKAPFIPLLPGFKHVKYGDAEAVAKSITPDTAAVIVEPVQGENGVVIPPEGYLKQLREICDEKDVLLIFDEVQTGFGRTGKFFACQHWNVIPDIMSLAKGIAGGVPMGATVAKEHIWESMKKGEHGSTFGGNPLACAASVAAIDTLVKDKLPERAAKIGGYFLKRLKEELEGIRIIRDIRGIGLMLAVELRVRAKDYVIRLLKEENVLVLTSGATILRMLPPLVITEEQVNRVIEALKNVLSS